MKKIKNILTLIFVLVMAAVSMSSCLCTYDPYYTPTHEVYVGSNTLAKEIDTARWQAQQRANTARQAYENELWQMRQR